MNMEQCRLGYCNLFSLKRKVTDDAEDTL